MAKRRVPRTKDEWARRGHAKYLRRILPKLKREKKGRFVAIDIDSPDYEVADDVLGACDALLARRPKARIWLEKLGYKTSMCIRQRIEQSARVVARMPPGHSKRAVAMTADA